MSSISFSERFQHWAAFFGVVFILMSGNAEAQAKRSIDSLVFTKVYSRTLDEERKIVVHLPLNYSVQADKKYPVMYVLDAGQLDFDITDRLFTLSSAGLVPECIVVGILNNKGKREENLTPPFMQTEVEDTASPSGKADIFLNFVETELIPLIDSSYRTSGYQTISGHSRAGLFVLYTAIKRPLLFNARFCFSTPAWRFDNKIIKQLEEKLTLLPELNGYLFFSVGENENVNIVSAFHSLNRMLTKLHLKQFKFDSHLTPLSNHQTNPVFSAARAMFSWSQFLEGTATEK